MASTAWRGTDVKVTSGSKTVEVTRNADTDDISKIKVDGEFVASNFSLPYEVERTYTSGATDFIVLKEEWEGASGSGLTAVVATSPAAIESARQALVELIATYENFADSVSPSATSDSVVQRTANGRIKASAGVAADEVAVQSQLGTAASKNVGKNAGELMEVGAFGWGLASSPLGLPENNLDASTTPSGSYRVDTNTTGTYPTGFNAFGTLIVQRMNSVQTSQTLIDSGGRLAIRYGLSGGGWQDWLIFYHQDNTGDVVTRDVITSSSDTITGRVLTNVADFNFFALRDYGGYFPSTSGANIDTEPSGSKGLYATGNDGTFPIDPLGAIGFYNVKTEQTYTGQAKHQHAIGYYGSNAGNDIPLEAFRTLDNQGTAWTPWAIKLTDRNTNLNEFGGLATSVVAVGTARTNSEILFYLPINSYERPAGITVTSTFNLRGENNVPIGNEELTLSGTFNATLSSERFAVLIVGGLTNITQGNVYRLQCHTNISRIKVNF